NAPKNTQVNTPVNAPKNTQVNTPVNAPKNTQVNTPVNAPKNTQVNTPVNAPKNTQVNTPVNAPKNAPVDVPKKTPVKTSEEKTSTNSNVKASAVAPIAENIQDSSKNESNNNVVTGVAVTGSVLGAAGAFLFLKKKNPKQYQNLKRSLSQKATTLKRGASTIGRRATERATTLSRKMSKRSRPETTPQSTIDPTNENYRYKFSQEQFGL
ncbi:hypothetical protein PIROE2DRAFT_13312, partial [Piromyces sp. E2]